jgi:hypothetical protein
VGNRGRRLRDSASITSSRSNRRSSSGLSRGSALFVDLAHADRAEWRDDFVGAEFRAGAEHQFVSPAGQFTMTVIGVGSDSTTGS